MTDFDVFVRAFKNAGYDVEVNDYGEYGAEIDIKKLDLSFQFKDGKLDYIINERYQDY